MDESTRTKVLGGVLVGIVGFMFGKPILMGPIDDAKKELANTGRRYEVAENKDWQVDLAKQSIENGRQKSLPPRASDAQRLYQTWITNLAEQCKFAQLNVTPGKTETRKGKYVSVTVAVEAETSMEGLSRFLYMFEQADLLHRISSLEVESTGSQGSPRMEVTLSAEGMSVAGSPSKGDVFSRTYLPETLDADSTELVVGESADFPEKFPFKAQVGREMVNVLEADGNKWTIERGVEGTKPTAHQDNEYVQLFPIAGLRKDIGFDQYEDFVNASLFVKPAPKKTYSPTLDVANKTIERGKTLKMTVKPRGMNPDIGEAVVSVDGKLDDMTFDPKTGSFEWTPGETVEPKKYDLTFLLTQKNNDDLNIEKQMSITVQLANAAPTLEVPSSAVAILGRDFQLELKADDDGDLDDLKFSLEDAPEGLTVSGTSLVWNPPKTFTPGDFTVSVKVTDSGSPAKTATKQLALKVQDDTAAVTRFTGAVGLDGVPVAWFYNQMENKRPELKQGDRLAVADIDVELTEIAKRHVLMADAEGIWKLRLGENVRQRELIEPAEKVVEENTESEATETVGSDEKPTAEATDEATTTDQPDYDKDPPAEDGDSAAENATTEEESAQPVPAGSEPTETKSDEAK